MRPGETAGASGEPRGELPLEDSAEDLYDNAPCGYLSALLDGTIVKVNQTFLTWTGYRREDLVGRRRFQDLLTAGGRIFHETHYAPLLRMQGRVREIAVDVVCADGRRLPALVNAALKTDQSGTPVLVRTTVFDATERREYERELLRERRRAEESEGRARVLAQTLQASLIPPAPPEIPRLDVAAIYRPAGHGDEVGGDFYDVFETGDGSWAVVLGDVCGKGAPAATITALARHTVRAAAVQTTQPDVVLATLNGALLRHDPDRFCTVVYAHVRVPDRGPVALSIASGGHPLPLLLRDDAPPVAIGGAGQLLGVFPQPSLRAAGLELRSEDVVVFFTDGVTEGRGDAGFYGEERLRSVISASRGDDASRIARRIVTDVVEFQAGLPRDDIAVVVARVP